MRFLIAAAILLGATAADARQLQFYNYGTGSNPESHYTQGYTRQNGTYVQGYHATNPNGYLGDNYNAPGNVNPWNGAVGGQQEGY